MDDIFKSIKAFLYDRVASPLFGAFVTAWSIWNYRVISILLSDENELKGTEGLKNKQLFTLLILINK